VTEEQARERCRELAETSPDRDTHSWIAREDEGGRWSVVRLAVPPARPPQMQASKPSEPQTAKDDPRIAFEQNVPNHGVGL
jgi:hypothetical protein